MVQVRGLADKTTDKEPEPVRKEVGRLKRESCSHIYIYIHYNNRHTHHCKKGGGGTRGGHTKQTLSRFFLFFSACY